MTSRICGVLVVGLAMGVFIAPAVQAQGEEQRGARLEEVVVTAEKRAQNVQSVPISISAFSEKMLTDFRVVNTGELMTFTPSLNITRANTATIPFIRGVGNFTATPGNEAAVVTYVDDVYYPSPAGSTYSFNNIERIEVLKGPQGTLFGRNAAGGVVNIISKDPSKDAYMDASVGYGSYETVEANFYGSTPITERVGANLAVYYNDQGEGWGHNVLNGREVYFSNSLALRSKVVFEPSDNFRLRLTADYSKTRDDITPTWNILEGTTTLAGFKSPGGFYDTSANYGPTKGEQTQWGLAMRGDVDLGFATAASITAFRSNQGLAIADLDASPANLVTFVNNVNQATFTQEFQLASTTSSGIQWIGGLFLYFDDAALDPTTQMAAPFANLPRSTRVLFDRQDTQSYAPFGQVTVPFLSDTTRVTVGARYTADKRSFEYRIETVNGAINSSANPPPSTWPKVTWRLSLDHDFAADILGYVSYNRGFKSGNYNLNGPTQPPVFPEVIDAYEIGMKTELFGGRARLNWSAYYYDITDKQVQSATLGGNIQTNAAAAEHKGIDVDLMFLPTENLTVAMGLALLDAKYTKFPGATFNFPCLTPTTAPACAASVNGGGYYSMFQDASGLRPHYTERGTGTLSANYTVPSRFGDLQFIGSVAYHDGFFFDVQNILEQPSYTIANASVVWSTPSDKWDVTLWGKNLTGEEYFAQEQVNQNGAVYAPQPPRSYGLTFGYHFN